MNKNSGNRQRTGGQQGKQSRKTNRQKGRQTRQNRQTSGRLMPKIGGRDGLFFPSRSHNGDYVCGPTFFLSPEILMQSHQDNLDNLTQLVRAGILWKECSIRDIRRVQCLPSPVYFVYLVPLVYFLPCPLRIPAPFGHLSLLRMSVALIIHFRLSGSSGLLITSASETYYTGSHPSLCLPCLPTCRSSVDPHCFRVANLHISSVDIKSGNPHTVCSTYILSTRQSNLVLQLLVTGSSF